MIRLTYAPDLMEETVLLAERTMDRQDAAAFRRERNRIYERSDEEQREVAFRQVHLRWFVCLGIHERIEPVVNGCIRHGHRLSEARVVRAVSRKEEGADLLDPVLRQDDDPRPLLVIRLKPASLLDGPAVRALLLHELMHVDDMLDPRFGYERTLARSDDGPSGDNILRDRYRVLWDVTIDGRLALAGKGDDGAREARYREFAAAFASLGDRTGEVFAEWFDRVQPTHRALVDFARHPGAADTAAENDSGRCPLCRFPVASLDPHPARLSLAARALIGVEHPAWRIELGLCSQCLDLYEARQEEHIEISRR